MWTLINIPINFGYGVQTVVIYLGLRWEEDIGVEVLHLRYNDDTLVLCKAIPQQLGYPCCVLLCFEAVSGMRVHL